ncbi:hypothetical protein NLG97_g4140 [Lecanicillium saksenae]|uniref:Uncharacterized protein n=1 Tax=Lecanicillium saksenae TaxID=468837 RepID=A0ACC1R019_9HYPO|nr:hypothetical protein NLG97_g4140 [Lecanicillium saksenae]
MTQQGRASNQFRLQDDSHWRLKSTSRIAHDADSSIIQTTEPDTMAILRHSIAPLRAVRCARQPAAAMRSFSVTANRRGGGHGNDLVVAGVALAFKPDTSVSTWALEEARRRLEAEGVLPDPESQNKK